MPSLARAPLPVRRPGPAWRLGTASINLEHVDLTADVDLDAAAAVLSPAERAYADRAVPAVRCRRILTRAALRTLLSALTGIDPAAVPLADRAGRPTWAPGSAHPDLEMSTAAAGPVGLVAVVRGARVGVDVEPVLRETLSTGELAEWLTDREIAAVFALPPAQQRAVLTRCWVQKEAVLKGAGTRLQADLRSVETPLADRGRAGDWLLHPVDVPAGLVASLALRPHRAADRRATVLAWSRR